VGLAFVTVTFVTSYFSNKKINKLTYERDVELQPKQRKRDYINRVFYLNDFAKEIRLSDIKNKLYKDYSDSNDSIKDTLKATSKKITLYSFLNDFVFNTLVINVSGCFILALLLTVAFEIWEFDAEIRLGIGTGFLGAYTTFSTLCRETTELLFKGYYFSAVSYITISVVLGLAAVYLGVVLAREVVAKLLKIERRDRKSG
jgi:CrcB protein